MSKAVYIISGSLPSTWEDFVTNDKDLPYFSIYTRDERDKQFTEYKVETNEGPNGRWVDIYLPAEVLTKELAINEIKKYLNISYNEVEIIENHLCQAV